MHRLRDVEEPVRLFQVGGGEFPALRVVGGGHESNLPARPTRLIGRDEDLGSVRRLLAEYRLVTVTAVGGSGKTRLAVVIGEAELGRRRGGVWFVDLTSVTNPADVAAAVGGALGLRMTGDAPTGQVVAYLSDKSALVILDNCEHVIDACADFAEVFLATPGEAVLLATSREALEVVGEQVMGLSALAATSTAGSVMDSPAVQLFAERATSMDSSFGLDAETAVTVATLCDRLDGIPLAIELAAARIGVFTPAELLAGLGDRFNLLSGGRRRQRQRTLDWSYDLLEDEQQRVFRAIGVFVGGFDLAAVATVSGISRVVATDHIEALLAKSLVVRADTGAVARFRLLETLKAYTEDRLVQTDEARAVRDRHAEHFHRLAMVAGRVVAANVRVGELLRDDKSNITAVFEWTASIDEWVIAGELLLGSLAVYENNSHAAETVALVDRCQEPLQDSDRDLADQLSASILWSLTILDDYQSMVRVAHGLMEAPDPRCRVMGCAMLAFASALGDFTAAQEFLERGTRYLAMAQAELLVSIPISLMACSRAIGHATPSSWATTPRPWQPWIKAPTICPAMTTSLAQTSPNTARRRCASCYSVNLRKLLNASSRSKTFHTRTVRVTSAVLSPT